MHEQPNLIRVVENQEVIPVTAEELAEKIKSLRAILASLEKDPNFEKERIDLGKMIPNLEARLAGMQN